MKTKQTNLLRVRGILALVLIMATLDVSPLYAGTTVSPNGRLQIAARGAIDEPAAQPVAGKVTDTTGEPLPGVTVFVKGNAMQGTITDTDGNYALLNVPSNATLVFSFVGMKTQEVSLEGKSNIDVVMQDETIGIKDVVITALGIPKEEKSLGYSVQKVNADLLSKVKSTSITNSLTGKVAGLLVENTTEFFRSSTVKLRGEDALIVVNGVPAPNVSLDDFSSEDIADISILKGATASALYGNRGRNGAIMITTKKGTGDKTLIEVNSSTLVSAGYLRIPGNQTSYGTGTGNQAVYNGQFVWGPKLDIGQTARQVDLENGELSETETPLVSKGKTNLRNFLSESLITNNNISVSRSGEFGSIRASLSHMYNKGQAPNTRLNKYIFDLSSSFKVSKDFSLDASWMFSRRETPNEPSTGYGQGGSYIYDLTIWNGADFDIREWRDYWKIKGKEQKYYQTAWYNNPYFVAYEDLKPRSIDVNNGSFSANYNITPLLKVLLRTGLNTYSNRYSHRTAISFNRTGQGYFETGQSYYMDLNNDLVLSFNKKFKSFGIDLLGGGSLSYYQYRETSANTNGGLSIPKYYSLNASVDPVSASSSFERKQVNSLYSKLSVSFKDALYLDLTGRNDWSSTLPSSSRSYFYPSVAFSSLISQIVKLPAYIDLWKIRAAWTVSKNDLGIYDLNEAYDVNVNSWNGNNSETLTSTIRDQNVKSQTDRTYEIGTEFKLFKGRLGLDYSYFNKLEYHYLVSASISQASGFSYKKTNTDESWIQRGMEIALRGTPVKNKNTEWNILVNGAFNHWYYKDLDSRYSLQRVYVKKGERYDYVSTKDWERDRNGNIVHGPDGFPKQSEYDSEKIGCSDPDFFWGMTNTLRYKNWSFLVTLDGRIGGLAYSNTEYGLWSAGSHPDSDNQWRYDEVVNGETNYVGKGVRIVSGDLIRNESGAVIEDSRVFAENDIKVPYTEYMKTWSGYGTGIGNRALYLDETFVKLREVSVSYNFPGSFAKTLGFSGGSIGIVGNNLLIWTKDFRFDDPDGGTGNVPSPSLRYIGYNLKLNF